MLLFSASVKAGSESFDSPEPEAISIYERSTQSSLALDSQGRRATMNVRRRPEFASFAETFAVGTSCLHGFPHAVKGLIPQQRVSSNQIGISFEPAPKWALERLQVTVSGISILLYVDWYRQANGSPRALQSGIVHWHMLLHVLHTV